MQEVSFGERIIRTSFNPSNQTEVQHIKERAAEFINYLVNLPKLEPSHDEVRYADRRRLLELATNAIELASMYAVKASTI